MNGSHMCVYIPHHFMTNCATLVCGRTCCIFPQPVRLITREERIGVKSDKKYHTL